MSPPDRQPAAGGGRWLVLAGAAIALLAFRSLLDPSRILAIGDLAFFHLPLRTLLARAVSEGEPLWSSWLHGGQPILSNPNYAAFYPPTWLGLVLPPALAIQALLLGHAAWAFAGAWRLARYLGCDRSASALAAVAFTASGTFVSSATLLNLFNGLAWTPWVLLWGMRTLEPGERPGEASWRRHVALLALALAAQFLAGEPVNAILSGVALAGLALDSLISGRRTAPRLLAAVGLALLIGSAQLLPTASRLAASPRGGGIDREAATARSLPPARLLEWAIPHPVGDPMRVDEHLYFGDEVEDTGFPYLISIYPGFLVLVLALGGLGRRRLPWRATWLATIGGGVFLALGRHNPLWELVVPWVPILDQTRYPEKMLILASAALPFVAALTWSGRHEEGRQRRSADLPLLLAALGASLLGGLLLLLLHRPEGVVWLASHLRSVPMSPAAETDLMAWARTELLIGLATGLAACVLLALRRRAARRRLGAALIVLVGLDLLGNAWNLLPTVPLESVTEPPRVLQGVEPEGRLLTDLMFSPDAQVPLVYERPGPMSFWHGIETLEPYVATLWGWSYALNHDYDLMLTEPARQALDAFAEDWATPYRAWRFAGAWGVSTLALHRPVTDVLRDRFEGRPERRMALEPNPHRLPWARVVPEVRWHADPQMALAAARDDEYRFDLRAHWVGEERPSRSGPGARIVEATPGGSRVALRVVATGGALVQVATTWDRGWSAAAGGEAIPVRRTATGQIGLEIPPDATEIELRYTDPTVPLGALGSLLGLALAAWLRRRGAGVGSGDAPTP